MPSMGPTELIIILVILLIIVGPGKLSGLGSSLGKSLREFRKATKEEELEEEAEPERREVTATESRVVVEEERRESRRPTVSLGEEPGAAPTGEVDSRSRSS